MRESAEEEAGYGDPEVQARKIVTLLRQIEVSIGNGKTTPQACNEVCLYSAVFQCGY